ncbi:hypothetical protein KEJ18_04175 [Candidatus Bathyarchaeota archaeon]|nr:hypothetical protein [Candidatus Bathyarchaeota archaeon]
MTVKSITYFEKSGSKNTDETLNLAYKRASELGIRDIVVASTHGKTALKVAEIFDTKKNNIVAVTISEGFRAKGWTMTTEERERLQEKGVKVLTCIHALGGDLGSAFAEENGGTTIQEAVCQTLYRFCQGMKVAVEIVLMAADAGLIPVDKEVIAIAGTGTGADTAIVVQPAYLRKFFDLRIKEIIAKPRG